MIEPGYCFCCGNKFERDREWVPCGCGEKHYLCYKCYTLFRYRGVHQQLFVFRECPTLERAIAKILSGSAGKSGDEWEIDDPEQKEKLKEFEASWRRKKENKE